jgi:hypothetical protein
MSSLKSKVTEGVERAKNAAAEATTKIGNSAAEAFHKGEHAITDAARAVKDLAAGTGDKLKHAADKVAEKTPSEGVARSPKAAANKVNKSN